MRSSRTSPVQSFIFRNTAVNNIRPFLSIVMLAPGILAQTPAPPKSASSSDDYRSVIVEEEVLDTAIRETQDVLVDRALKHEVLNAPRKAFDTLQDANNKGHAVRKLGEGISIDLHDGDIENAEEKIGRINRSIHSAVDLAMPERGRSILRIFEGGEVNSPGFVETWDKLYGLAEDEAARRQQDGENITPYRVIFEEAKDRILGTTPQPKQSDAGQATNPLQGALDEFNQELFEQTHKLPLDVTEPSGTDYKEDLEAAISDMAEADRKASDIISEFKSWLDNELPERRAEYMEKLTRANTNYEQELVRIAETSAGIGESFAQALLIADQFMQSVYMLQQEAERSAFESQLAKPVAGYQKGLRTPRARSGQRNDGKTLVPDRGQRNDGKTIAPDPGQRNNGSTLVNDPGQRLPQKTVSTTEPRAMSGPKVVRGGSRSNGNNGSNGTIEKMDTTKGFRNYLKPGG